MSLTYHYRQVFPFAGAVILWHLGYMVDYARTSRPFLNTVVLG